MNLGQMKLMFNLKNRTIPTQEEVNQAKITISKHTYPIGVITTFVFNETQVYKNHSVSDNYTYLQNFISTVFNEYYTEDEQIILSLFLLQAIYNIDMSLRRIALKFAEPYLFTHFEKKDVEFCLNTLRYVRLTLLLYESNPDDKLIQRLFEELEGVEEEYNNMVLGENELPDGINPMQNNI